MAGRQGKRPPVELKPQVHALLTEGRTDHEVAKIVGIDHKTVTAWRAKFPSLPAEQEAHLLENSRRIALEADDLIELAFDNILTQGNPQEYLRDLNAIAGTHRDKLMAAPVIHQHLHIDGDPTMIALAQQRLGELEAALKQQADEP